MCSITIRAAVCASFVLLLCVNHIAAVFEQQVQSQSQSQPQKGPSPTYGPPTQQNWNHNGRGSQRHQTAAAQSAPGTFARQHMEIKDVMNNLHDRVGILATLDEDQRHRLEVIDKKIDELLASNAGRLESLKAQQVDFTQKISSLEHIQRLTRNTLDELQGERDAVYGPRAVRELKYKKKNRRRLQELSRQQRAATQQQQQQQQPQQQQQSDYYQDNMQSLFGNNHSNANVLTNQDLSDRLDALATLLATISGRVYDTQQSVLQLGKSTSNLRRRLAAQAKRANAVQVALPAGGIQQEEIATSCQPDSYAINGILKLQLSADSEPFYVPCQDDGWTVIMNRSSDALSFERSWLEYKNGFGNLAGDFFIGLEKLYALTSSTLYELRIELENFSDDTAYAGYDAFAIGSEREQYALQLLGNYQEDLLPGAGDSLRYQAGSKFSTFDNDNDNCADCNCAQRLRGGGWFNACGRTNLMGVYHSVQPEQSDETGIYWDTFQGVNVSLRSVKMLIRPVGLDEARR